MTAGFSKKIQTFFLFLLVLFIGGSAISAFSQGAETKSDPLFSPAQYFSGFDRVSDLEINHQPLTDMLQDTVLPMGKSPRRLGYKGKTEQFQNSRIKATVNSLPSRYEGNRLMIHAFTDQHGDFFLGYQEGLERLSNRIPLAALNKDEQLAYWLNLYNVVVLNKIIEEYPISNTRALRKNKDSFWYQKSATVEGIPLSLVDIETIIIQNWETPLVIYGLWQGSIGGPHLARDAFTGKNVWDILQKSATEFVNSNRGVIPKKDKLEVSIFYEWTRGAFRNSDTRLLNHINSLAEPDFMGDISGLSKVSYKYFDWQVADLIGGTLYTGAQFASNIRGDLFMTDSGRRSSAINKLPPQAIEMFREMSKEKVLPKIFVPLITTEECAPGEACGVEEDPETEDPDQ